jgi:hypothetical protein
LLSGFSAGTTYSVTVTLYANANYTGSSASSSTSFTTASGTPGTTTSTTTTTTSDPLCGIMPNVVGMTNSQASDAIVARGIAYEFTYFTSIGATAQNDGTVQSQDPAPGTNVGSCDFSYNAAVTLYQYVAASTTTTTTSGPSGAPYWYTGCCSTTGLQVTGSSTNDFGTAFVNMNNQCSGGTVTDTSSGNYGTIPTKSCTTTSTTTTTTTAGSTGSVIYSIGSYSAAACNSGYSTSTSGSGTGPGGGGTISTPCGSFYVPGGVPYGWRCCAENTTAAPTTAAPTTAAPTTAAPSGCTVSSPCGISGCCPYGAGTEDCTTPGGLSGTRSFCITPNGCPNTYGTCVANPGQETTAAPTTTQNPGSSCDTPGQVVSYGSTPSCGPGCTTTSSGSGTGTGYSVGTPCGTFYGISGVPYSWKCCG